MAERLATVALVVPDYDAAIAYYVDVLGFALHEDTPLGGGKRWVVVGPAHGARLLLAKAANAQQEAAIGGQTGGRVSFFLETDDFEVRWAAFQAAGVRFREPPRQEPYGTVAVFEDAFGNLWDLIEPTA